MDPIRNPYAPGAGQRPPELAGRDAEMDMFQVVLERIQRGRPERSLVLTGLRGVGKTVLLNSLRSSAVRARWGTGKIEARPGAELRRPLSAALHQAIRELGIRDEESRRHVLGILKSFAQRSTPSDAKLRDKWQPGIDVPAVSGRADSGDIEIDLVELFSDIAGLSLDVGKGVAVFIDEMQDLGADDVSALCAACHEISQQGLPFVVVGAGLPHLPAVLSASKSYSERLFRYRRIDRLDREEADRALRTPALEEGADFTAEALDALYTATDGYPYFVQAYGKAAWDVAPRSPISAEDVRVGAPSAQAELAVGFFGSRYERATPAEREYMRALADLEVVGKAGTSGEDPAAEAHAHSADEARSGAEDGGGAEAADGGPAEAPQGVATKDLAVHLGRKPQSLSPARDGLIKKGLVYSAERGRIAFTVPHFGRYLRGQNG
ncbi:ATP-binding protein [Brevibacterium litoralis]|uniref:ATP-binding protein n=1 Tax=Brevibacterium litoralis TaxID=3138935 RepID=UPI0032EE7552